MLKTNKKILICVLSLCSFVILSCSANITSNLQLSWNFDDGSGFVVLDNSGYGRNGAITNAIWSSGIIGNSALVFDGSGDKVVVSNPLLTGNRSFTFSCWLNASSISSIKTIWELRADASNGFVSYLNNGVLNIQIDGSFYNIDSCVISANSVYHLVMVYNGDNFYAYLNGSLVDSVDTVSFSLNQASNFIVGSTFDNMYSWSGKLDNVLYYFRVFSSSDVMELYQFYTVHQVTPTPTETTNIIEQQNLFSFILCIFISATILIANILFLLIRKKTIELIVVHLIIMLFSVILAIMYVLPINQIFGIFVAFISVVTFLGSILMVEA